MGAPFDATQPRCDFAAPAGADFHARELLEVRRDIAARRIRTGLGMRFRSVYQHVEVYREPQPHVVHRLAGLAIGSAVAPRMRIGLGIAELRFDIPQAVLALVAFAFDCARVYELAWSGRAERHVRVRDSKSQESGVSRVSCSRT